METGVAPLGLRAVLEVHHAKRAYEADEFNTAKSLQSTLKTGQGSDWLVVVVKMQLGGQFLVLSCPHCCCLTLPNFFLGDVSMPLVGDNGRHSADWLVCGYANAVGSFL